MSELDAEIEKMSIPARRAFHYWLGNKYIAGNGPALSPELIEAFAAGYRAGFAAVLVVDPREDAS